jgi:hypothetical protein
LRVGLAQPSNPAAEAASSWLGWAKEARRNSTGVFELIELARI